MSDVSVLLPPTSLERRAGLGLRAALVAIFLVFGLQKFTAAEALGIVPVVSHSPLTSWLMMLGVRNMGRVFGVFELTFGLLLAYGFRCPGSLTAILGASGACLTFLTTLSFLLTTPGVFVKGSEPVLSGDTGLFLLKDVVLLAVSVFLAAQGLAARERD